MIIHFKITRRLFNRIHSDLVRPHAFAFERVGFITARAGAVRGGIVLLAADYLPIADEDYLDQPGYGALMGPAAIRQALQYTFSHPVGILHVHSHGHKGRPRFSKIDEREMRMFVPDFFNARSDMPHGAVVLSHNSIRGYVWLSRNRGPLQIRRISIVGQPMALIGDGDE
jgi:hypothetical protein